MNSFCKLWRLLYPSLLPFVTQHFNKICDDVFMDTVGKGWEGPLEVSRATSCLHIGMSPMWPVMFWVSSRRNCLLVQPVPELAHSLGNFFFLLLHWNLLYSSFCLLCYILLLCTSEGGCLSSLHLPKGGCSSTKISPFLKAGVMSLITLVSSNFCICSLSLGQCLSSDQWHSASIQIMDR